ncbi:MAG: hypothetical protein Q9163_006496 [Psora crenata]
MHPRVIGRCDEYAYDGSPSAGRSALVVLARDTALKPPAPAFIPPAVSSKKLGISRPYQAGLEQLLPPSPLSASTQSLSKPCPSPLFAPNSNDSLPRHSPNQRRVSLPHPEKARLSPPNPAHLGVRTTSDREKASYDQRSMQSYPASNTHSHHTTVIYEEDDEEEDERDPKKHAAWILPIRAHMTRFLVPPLQLQLGLIFTIYETCEAPSPSSMLILVTISFFSPLIALGVGIAAWVAASFWFFAAILGNPDGKDDKNDGRAAVMGVRRFWEAWLVRGLR